MRRLLIALALLPLGACLSTTGTTNFDHMMTTLVKNNRCQVKASFGAQAGVMNAASGANLNGSIDCEPAPEAPTSNSVAAQPPPQ